MNKNNFDSYLCNITAAKSVQHHCTAAADFSQHHPSSKKMCFDMMCKMMMS
ncbi:hypothetical protein [Chryseobacterium lactis]|jgi:hypothetical protein|uniref:hypothetical protein n=1 Tax=Chryseobacterium lactis TaxID=1241981 RepID=UPI0012E0A0A0|nr:hypothetical protein [Chryseobacterium lactis]